MEICHKDGCSCPDWVLPGMCSFVAHAKPQIFMEPTHWRRKVSIEFLGGWRLGSGGCIQPNQGRGTGISTIEVHYFPKVTCMNCVSLISHYEIDLSMSEHWQSTDVFRVRGVQMGRVGQQLGIEFVISVGDNFYQHGLTGPLDPKFAKSFSDVYTADSLQTQWFAGKPSFNISN